MYLPLARGSSQMPFVGIVRGRQRARRRRADVGKDNRPDDNFKARHYTASRS